MNLTGTVRVLTRKWPDAPHWEYDAVPLGSDAHGDWVGVPAGTWLAKPDRGFTAWCDHVVLLPRDSWWVATLYGDDPALDADRPVDVYVDIATPSTWSSGSDRVSAVDLDLDVIRDPDGRVWIDDEDEFAEHQQLLGYPAEIVEAAKTSCAEVLAAVTGRRAPYDGSHLPWLARLRGLTTRD